jgi:tetratricopeptide (TPR) repeat protein
MSIHPNGLPCRVAPWPDWAADQEALPLLNHGDRRRFFGQSDTYAARGAVLLSQGQAEAAREDLEKSLGLKPNGLAAGALADLLLTGAPSINTTLDGPRANRSRFRKGAPRSRSWTTIRSWPVAQNPQGDAYRIEFEKKRLAAMQATNSWVRLLLAYQLHGRDAESAALAETHPEILRVIADDQFGNADWDAAIAGYSKLIDNETTDASLLVKRGEAYFAAKQSDRARADWRRAAKLVPELAQTQFDRLRLVSRWGEAAEFGLLLIEQKPEDTMLWVRVPPLAVLSEDDAVYPEVCRAILEIFREAPTPTNVDRAIKACLLKPGAIEQAELPLNLVPVSLDEATVPNWLPPWFWSTRALLAYRGNDAEAAVRYVEKSEAYEPPELAHALNLAVLAMAEHQLGKAGEAKTALQAASQLITRLKEDPGLKGDHDLLIAEILLHEADALINGKKVPQE